MGPSFNPLRVPNELIFNARWCETSAATCVAGVKSEQWVNVCLHKMMWWGPLCESLMLLELLHGLRKLAELQHDRVKVQSRRFGAVAGAGALQTPEQLLGLEWGSLVCSLHLSLVMTRTGFRWWPRHAGPGRMEVVQPAVLLPPAGVIPGAASHASASSPVTMCAMVHDRAGAEVLLVAWTTGQACSCPCQHPPATCRRDAPELPHALLQAPLARRSPLVQAA